MNTTATPIFIIGCPRSGTTLLRLMLDAHPNISCGPESHFLLNLRPMLGRQWHQLCLYGFPDVYWQQQIAHFFSAFHEKYARQRGKQRWADKTPQYTLHLDFILTLFPQCQLVHILRDGRDVVTSHLQRWGYRRAVYSINDRKVYLTTARAYGQKLPAYQYHEVRYEALVSQPETTLRHLLAYLQEPWDEQPLSYTQVPHDIRPVYAEHISKQRQKAGNDRDIYVTRVGAWRTELPFSLRWLFYQQAGKLLKELGYQ
jgi:hypothetical protein